MGELRQRVEAIAREAGALLLSHRGRLESVEKKGARDLVSEADRGAEELIVSRLQGLVPGATFLAEESAHDTRPGEATWIIDPLDGTTNFVHGLPVFAVSIALWRHGSPEIGCVHVPVLDESFSAEAGQGATLNGTPIHRADDVPLSEAVVATGFHYHREEQPNSNLAHFADIALRCRAIRRMGSAAVDLAYTACGKLHAYWELWLSPWDVAAGGLIAQEAGAFVSGIHPDQPDWLLGKQVLAGPPRLREEIRALLLAAAPDRLPGPGYRA